MHCLECSVQEKAGQAKLTVFIGLIVGPLLAARFTPIDADFEVKTPERWKELHGKRTTRMIASAWVCVFLLQVGLVHGAEPEDEQLAAHSKRAASKAMMKDRTISRRALARVAVSAGFSQSTNKPHEWGRNIGGLGKRVGSTFGILVIKNSVQFSVGYIRHEEFGYQPSGKVGFRPRLTYALLSTVRTRDTRSHERKWATGRMAGVLASGVVSRLWQPVRLRTFANGFSSAGISLGVDAGTNVLREFWPEIRHPHRRLVHGVAAGLNDASPVPLEGSASSRRRGIPKRFAFLPRRGRRTS